MSENDSYVYEESLKVVLLELGKLYKATDDQAEEVCAEIRKVLGGLYGNTAEKIRIQYGGSVNGKNAEGLFAMADIDGGLIGGASLKAEFKDIINSVK